jgi:hypothetical protein
MNLKGESSDTRSLEKWDSGYSSIEGYKKAVVTKFCDDRFFIVESRKKFRCLERNIVVGRRSGISGDGF